MMNSKNIIEKVCVELLPFYEKHASIDDLHKVAEIAADKAKENYFKLRNPKTCDFVTYIAQWTAKAILLDVQLNHRWLRDLEKKDKRLDDVVDETIAFNQKYFKYGLDLDTTPELWKKIDKRVTVESEDQLLDDFMPLFNKLEPIFTQWRKAFNKRANLLGFESQTDLVLNNLRITSQDYQFFLDNKDKVIEYCQQQISEVTPPTWFYSQFNSQIKHDFLSLLPTFPEISYPNGVSELVTKYYPILNKYHSKLRIEQIDGGGSAQYIEEDDIFWVGIDKNSENRHKVTILFHELGHVVGTLDNFSKGISTRAKGLDVSETEAYTASLKILKKFSSSVYQAQMSEVLNIFVETLFQIEMFKDPDQNLARLYAKTYNYCFPKAKQTENYTYLIKFNTVFQPLRHLPHAIALVKVLSNVKN